MKWKDRSSFVQEISNERLLHKEISLFILRDDLLHPGISGNKWRKLKYNIIGALEANAQTLVTVGGFHSNHISAVAFAGKEFGLKTIGVIQGYEGQELSPTIVSAQNNGMEIQLLNKTEFREFQSGGFVSFCNKIPNAFYVPIGGGNENGTKGCVEINIDIPQDVTHIACSCGTGSTVAGIFAGAKPHQKVLGFSPFKNGAFLRKDIENFAKGVGGKNSQSQLELMLMYYDKGFGKLSAEVAQFITDFHDTYNIPLDGVYNGKMVFGVFDLIEKGYFKPGSKIMLIHTGGVQGNAGLNKKYGYNLPEHSPQ